MNPIMFDSLIRKDLRLAIGTIIVREEDFCTLTIVIETINSNGVILPHACKKKIVILCIWFPLKAFDAESMTET